MTGQVRPIGERIPDVPCVPVRSLLRPSAFRVFDREARRRGITVAELLSRMADDVAHRSSAPAPDEPLLHAERVQEAAEAREDPEPILSRPAGAQRRKRPVVLTDEQRTEVVRLRQDPQLALTHADLAARFNVSIPMIRIVLRDARNRGEVIP